MTAPARTDRAARDAKLDELHQQLASAVEGLVTSEDWKQALTFASRFRARSFSNTMLIWSQHRTAYGEGRVPTDTPTYVAGFKQWLTLDRHVLKGQRGYGILAPVTARMASRTPSDPHSWRRLQRGARPLPGEVVQSRLIGVKPAHVWDISQTDGKPVPELPQPALLTGEAPAGLWDGLADQITDRGYELRLVSTAASIGGANGLTDFLTREVSVRMDMDDAAQVKTLAHELGHVLLHAPHATDLAAKPSTGETAHHTIGVASDATLHRGIAEVEAESVALMVGAAHGLDTTDYTIPYVATWANSVPGKEPIAVVQATAERVRSAALGILNQLDTAKIGDGTPPGLDRNAPALRPASAVGTPRREAVIEL